MRYSRNRRLGGRRVDERGVAVRVLLLGQPAVVDHERALAIGSARQATVLAALAGRAGEVVSTEHLIDDVWGFGAPPTARNTLQVHVSGLRRLLGAESVEGTREGYRYAGERGDVDVVSFDELTRRGTDAVANHPEEAARLLRTALALYRDDLLGRLPLSPGMEAERERLRQLWATATMARVDADLALGRHLLLVDELLALARERPHDEEVAMRLMVARYRAGSQAEALDTYRRMERRLRIDLGVDPGPRLRELHQRILRQDAGLTPDLGYGAGWRVPLDAPDDELVGREALLATLESALGTGRLHTLVGPSGIGKTRVATELAARCQAWYPDGAVRVDLAGAGTVDGVLDRLTQALVGDLTAVPLDREERRRIVAEAKALVVLDDLAPEPSGRAALADLLASSGSGYVATSTRPAGLRGERIWSVPPLEDEDAAHLLLVRAEQAGAVLAADEVTRADARRCVDLLDGLPAAIELVAPLAVAGLPELAGTLERGKSRGLGARRVSFASSLDRLEAEERDLLDLLAVAGAPVDAELVEDAGHGDQLAALVRDGLVMRSPGSHGSHLFAVVGGLADHLALSGDPGARGDVPGRLLGALTRAVAVPDQYLTMLTADPARARRLVALEPALVRGVELARALGRVGPAAEIALVLPEVHFARYGVGPPVGRTDWLLECDDLEPTRRVDLLLSSAAVATVGGQPARVRAHLDEAERRSRALGDAGRLGQALAQRAMAQLLLSCHLGSCPESRREAVSLAESTGRPDVVASTLVQLYPTADTPPDLADTLERAVAASRTAHHQGLLAICLGNLGMAELDRGDVAAAVVHARESAALGRDQHHRALATISAEVAETAAVLSGSRDGLARVLGSLELAMGHRELRRTTEALLRLAAGLERLGHRGDAAACVGLFDALLISEGLAATAAERSFADHWLGDIVPVPPRGTVAEDVADLVRRLAEVAPAR